MESAHESNCCSIDKLFMNFCATRDIDIRNELLERHMYIARIAARKFVGRGVEYEDLLQIATLALLKALDRYDCSLGYKFSTFATPSVIGELKNYFRDRANLIRLPRKESELIASFEKAKQALTDALMRPPTIDEMAEYLELPRERVIEQIEARMSSSTASLDDASAENGRTLSETLGIEEDGFMRVENELSLKSMMSELSDIEREIINKRYYEGKSQREVAKNLSVSQMYVSRLERKILERFRKTLIGA